MSNSSSENIIKRNPIKQIWQRGAYQHPPHPGKLHSHQPKIRIIDIRHRRPCSFSQIAWCAFGEEMVSFAWNKVKKRTFTVDIITTGIVVDFPVPKMPQNWQTKAYFDVFLSGADPGGGVQGSKDPPWSPERGSWTPLPKWRKQHYYLQFYLIPPNKSL